MRWGSTSVHPRTATPTAAGPARPTTSRWTPGRIDSCHTYAYVGSRDHDDSDFWNAPFGALRGNDQMRSIDDLVTFWRAAQTLLMAHG